MASRSRFYVDTPHDAAQRHSMFVNHSELEQRRGASQSSTLPAAAGSVDRLTGLEEKKASRFFTLKPKSSLRSFFSSSSSLVSLSPAKKRRAPPRRQDSSAQTEEPRPEFGEVGVQTLNASTVDVPVQTCLEAWEEGDDHRPKRLALGSSSYWSRSVPSSALSSPSGFKIVPRDPLASPKVVKYAAPGASEKAAALRPSAVSSVDANDGQSPTRNTPGPHPCVPVEYFLGKEPARLAVSSPGAPHCLKDEADETDLLDLAAEPSADSAHLNSAPRSSNAGNVASDGGNDASGVPKCFSPEITNAPVSAIKLERNDSPSKRSKSVHFDLSDDKASRPKPDINQLRNVDKEFDAFLRDLNILTDDPQEDIQIDIGRGFRCDPQPKSPLLTPSLKSAIDVLRQDFLAPIPENSSECVEDSGGAVGQISPNEGEFLKCEPPAEVELKLKAEEQKVTPEAPEIGDCGDDSAKETVAKSAEPASPPVFASNPDAGTSCRGGNVYDNVIKEESLFRAAPLPTLPSFFEVTANPLPASCSAVVESAGSRVSDTPEASAEIPFEMDPGRSRLSRSSSRSSVLSNSKLCLDPFSESMSKYDSCENLEQLEEQFIRDLYSPEDTFEETVLENIDLPPSETFQNSGTKATHMRRVILDQLLSGKRVEDIVPNRSLYQRIRSDPGDRIKQPKKYKAVLTKLETSDGDPYFTKDNELVTSAAAGFESANHSHFNDKKPPKTASVFMFPEDNVSNNNGPEEIVLEMSAANVDKAAPLLEVRRSSWTPHASLNTTTSNGLGSKSSNSSQTDRDPEAAVKCDFTNCLKPSKIQNSSFLANLNRSMSPCPSPLLSNHRSTSPSKRNASPPKMAEAVGECDYANCLKPSQVQNSLFTAELSEITAGKSSNPALRSPSPMTARSSAPVQPSPSDFKCYSSDKNDESMPHPVQHKSELTITLQNANARAEKHGPPLEHKIMEYEKQVPDAAVSDSNASGGDSLATDAVAAPPPPPPMPIALKNNNSAPKNVCSVSLNITPDNQLSSSPRESNAAEPTRITCKTPVMAELENRLEMLSKVENSARTSDDKTESPCDTSCPDSPKAGRFEINLNGSSNSPSNHKLQNGNTVHFEQKDYNSSLSNGKTESHFTDTRSSFSPKTVITDEPPPPGAVLLDQRVTVDGDKVHTDKYYAIPVKEVLKEKTSTTKFIPAPPKYEGIGPTEDGVPIGLRNSVKKENMHNWYKTMFKSLHKADSPGDTQEYIIGYTSEPESTKKDIMMRKKSATMDYRNRTDANSNLKQNYPPAAKSSIEVYNVRPRMIEDYEPGHSSVTDDANHIVSRRYLPAMNVPKPSYEFKNGYESDTSIMKKSEKPEGLTPEQQKMWYREVQRGGEIPQYGLGKPAPDKPKEPVIGPVPPPPLNYTGQTIQQASRPSTLPTDYLNQNGNGYCQQMNGAYEMQMRQAIHSEMQHRKSPSSNQLSPPIRNLSKSPSKSPDLKIPARVLFDFRSESPKEISLRKGDMVLILRQLDKNWYEGEYKGVVGIFPISYVEIVPPEHVSPPIKIKTEGLGRALYDFVAQTSIELTVRKGDTITLLRRVDANWFEGVFNNKKGIIPISYIQVLQEPLDKSTSSPPSSYASSPRSVSEVRESHPKLEAVSPSKNFSSPQSTATSSLPITKERRLSKKGSNLIEPIMYRALYSYSPQNSDELELLEGDNICVVEMCDDGWYVGTSVRTGIFGIFPGNYVEKC